MVFPSPWRLSSRWAGFLNNRPPPTTQTGFSRASSELRSFESAQRAPPGNAKTSFSEVSRLKITSPQVCWQRPQRPLLAQKKGKERPAANPGRTSWLVLADDLASWMLGCYGNQEIRTPKYRPAGRAAELAF